MDIGAETLKPYLTGKCGKDFVINSELTLVESLFTKEEFRSCLSTCQRIIDVVWENLNTGHWKDVNDSWRNIYYVTSYYKCVSMEKLGMDVRECVKICDMGILMGVKPSEWSYPLTTLASSLGNGGGPATALHVNKCTDTGESDFIVRYYQNSINPIHVILFHTKGRRVILSVLCYHNIIL